MGLFSSGYTKEEQRVLETNIVDTMATGMSRGQAKKHVQQLLDMAIERSRKSGRYTLPMNFGDLVIGSSRTDDKDISDFAKLIKKDVDTYKKKEGITNEDVIFWWNLSDVERCYIQIEDDTFKLAFVNAKGEEIGGTPEHYMAEAAKELRKVSPMYGDPFDKSHTKGNDTPLPYELKLRVNNFFNYIGQNELMDELNAEKGNLSMNAYLRLKVKADEV